jgi:hypothetical protein
LVESDEADLDAEGSHDLDVTIRPHDSVGHHRKAEYNIIGNQEIAPRA